MHPFLLNKLHALENMTQSVYTTTAILWNKKLQKYVIFVFGGHLGRHIGFLGSPSFMSIYVGSSRNYRL